MHLVLRARNSSESFLHCLWYQALKRLLLHDWSLAEWVNQVDDPALRPGLI